MSMSAEDQADPYVPVPPSPFAKRVMGPISKLLNSPMSRLAGRRQFGVVAEVRHVGRRSGRTYRTTVNASIHGDVAVIPLTFGNQSDWSRNVRAAGGCTVRMKGRTYDATHPELLDIKDAQQLLRAAFSPVLRVFFRTYGLRQVMCLRVTPADG
jgi:deazaflavin-dependent oxidoreductase (nitroreductase family)